MSFFRFDIFRHVQRSFWQKISTVLSGDEFNTHACSKCSKIVNSSSCRTVISCLSSSLLRNVEDVPGIRLNQIELADGPPQLENGLSNHSNVKFVFLRCHKQLRGCKGHFVQSITGCGLHFWTNLNWSQKRAPLKKKYRSLLNQLRI